LLQSALMLFVLFCAVVLQDYARPYARPLVDMMEFLQLTACHFVLLLGLVYNSARAESETYAACIDTNISLSNITCLRNLEAIEAAQITQTLSTWIIFGIVILALGGALLLIYFQLQHALQELVQQDAAGPDQQENVKMAKLRELVSRVLNPSTQNDAMEWLSLSNESERDYFKHLLTQLDKSYQEWYDRQAKDVREFIESCFEKLVYNFTFLYKISRAFFTVLCCLGRKKRSVNEQPYMVPKPPPEHSLVAQEGRGRNKVAALFQGGKVRKRKSGVPAKQQSGPVANFHDDGNGLADDDLVRAYIRSITLQKDGPAVEPRPTLDPSAPSSPQGVAHDSALDPSAGPSGARTCIPQPVPVVHRT